MNKLVAYKQPKLAVLESKTKLRDYEESALNTICFELISHLLNLLAVSDGKTEHHNTLMTHVRDCYGMYTLEEIKHAFDLYVTNEFGIKPYQTLNAVVFGQVMREYEFKKRKELKNYRLKLQEFKNEAKPMTKEEENDIMEKAISDGLRNFKEKGMVENASSRYDWLDSTGKLLEAFSMTQEQFNQKKKSSYNTQKSKLEVEYENKNPINSQERTDIKNVLKELQNPKNGKIIAATKKMILIEYYNKIK